MMTATAKRIPTIKATSTENFYDVESSNGYDHYPLFYVGPGQVICGCPAGTIGKSCYHRIFAIANLVYFDPEISLRLAQLEADLKELNAVIWNSIQDQAESEMEKDAYRTMQEAA